MDIKEAIEKATPRPWARYDGNGNSCSECQERASHFVEDQEGWILCDFWNDAHMDSDKGTELASANSAITVAAVNSFSHAVALAQAVREWHGWHDQKPNSFWQCKNPLCVTAWSFLKAAGLQAAGLEERG